MSILGDTSPTQNQPSQGAINIPPGSRMAVNDNQVVRRYQDSYIVARTANTFGNIAKIAGFVCAGVIAFIGLLLTFITVSSFRDSGVAFVVFLIALTLGAVIGSIFYVFGLLLSALGQNLMATLDTAVHGSPFMNDEQKAQAMNLAK